MIGNIIKKNYPMGIYRNLRVKIRIPEFFRVFKKDPFVLWWQLNRFFFLLPPCVQMRTQSHC